MERELTRRFGIALVQASIFLLIVVLYRILVPAENQEWTHSVILVLLTVVIWIPTYKFLSRRWVNKGRAR